MVLFTGSVRLGKEGPVVSFSETANDPFDLCRKLFPHSCNVEKEFRMWIETPTKGGGQYWFDMCLITLDTKFFDLVMGPVFLNGATEVNVTIRGAKDPSPNTSPNEKPTKALTVTPERPYPASPLSYLHKNMSNITEATSGMTIAPSGSYDKYNAVNVKEPFTHEDISAASTGLIPLYFPTIQKGSSVVSQQVVLVNLVGLRKFVQHECNKAKEAANIHLRVECRDNKEKQFRLTASVWIGSILEHCGILRSFFAEQQYYKVLREKQLKELKGLKELYPKVQYWIADVFKFQEAEIRLQTPMEAQDVPKFMSPYYFTEMEARYLGSVALPGSLENLKSYLKYLAETEDNICTSHNLAPKLMRVFDIKNNFHKHKSFKKKYIAWQEAQAKIWSGKPTGLGE